MDDVIDKVMANLKLISMINKGEKLCIRKGQMNIEPEDRLQSLRRWYNKDSREVTLVHIRNTINEAIKIAKGLLSNNIQSDLKIWTVTALNIELKNSENGLQNLKTTYMDDSSFVANIDVLSDKCKAQCDEIDRVLLELSQDVTLSLPTTSVQNQRRFRNSTSGSNANAPSHS